MVQIMSHATLVNRCSVMMWHLNTIILMTVITLPACTYKQVSYERDITPIIASNCNECHTAPNGRGYRKTGLKMDSYNSIIQGTLYGPIIVAGDSRRSILNKIVEGRVGKKKCSLVSDKQDISDRDIELLKNWVNQGAINN